MADEDDLVTTRINMNLYPMSAKGEVVENIQLAGGTNVVALVVTSEKINEDRIDVTVKFAGGEPTTGEEALGSLLEYLSWLMDIVGEGEGEVDINDRDGTHVDPWPLHEEPRR